MENTDQASLEFLRTHSACGDGFDWAIQNGNIAGWWTACPHGDWLIWFVTHLGVDSKKVIRAAMACADLAYPFLTEKEVDARDGLETVNTWLDEKTGIQALGKAGRLADEAFVNANLRGDTSAAFAVKSIACVIKAAFWIDKDRYRANQFASKTCTWAAEAAGAASDPNGMDRQEVIEQLHQACADRVRALIPESEVSEPVKIYLESRNEPIPTR